MDLASFYEETDEFRESHGFTIAAGIIAWETLATSHENWRKSRIKIPPEIGALKFYYKIFDPVSGVYWKSIETEWCEQKDFDVESESNPDSRFFKTLRTQGDVRDFGPHLRCPVGPELMIYGSYESSVAQNLQIVLELCDPLKN